MHNCIHGLYARCNVNMKLMLIIERQLILTAKVISILFFYHLNIPVSKHVLIPIVIGKTKCECTAPTAMYKTT